jgi:hypothetical protein
MYGSASSAQGQPSQEPPQQEKPKEEGPIEGEYEEKK